MSETAVNLEPDNGDVNTEQILDEPVENSQSQDDVQFSSSAEETQFTDFGEQAATHRIERNSMDLLLDVEMLLTVELGRTNLTLKEVLDLAPNSVVELQKMAGEPLDVLVNNKLIAKGEVVVIDDNFGIKITQIISPSDRMEQTQ